MATYVICQQIFFFLLSFVHVGIWLTSLNQSSILFGPGSLITPVSSKSPTKFSPWFWLAGGISKYSIDLLSYCSLCLSLIFMSGLCQNAFILFLLYLAQVSLLSV
jgi:hypothetical protein